MSPAGFQINPQMRALHEKANAKPMGDPSTDAQTPQDEPASCVEMHNHGDGTYHTITHNADGSKGQPEEHASYDEAQQHQAEAFQEDQTPDMDDSADQAIPVSEHAGTGGSEEY